MYVRADCGSHCAEYGYNGTEGESNSWAFCEMHKNTQQPDKIAGCPPVAGFALTTVEAWVWPMFFRVPVRALAMSRDAS